MKLSGMAQDSQGVVAAFQIMSQTAYLQSVSASGHFQNKNKQTYRLECIHE
jgi:hypothetical protein